jgi:hypothetical protein
LAQKLADEKQKADLLLGNNVLAHVPDINDFVEGLKIALKADGIVTMEFPHLMQLVEQNQFDTIYHEHFSYFSLHTVKKIFAAHGLTIFDVQELPTHGGSLRIFARHNNNTNLPVLSAVTKLLETEARIGMTSIQYYKPFQQKVDRLKNDLLLFLIREKQQNRKIAAYGAAAKGNTLLNYCGIKNNLISFVADASPYKQGKYLPGSHIPVVPSEKIQSYKPDVLLILPWNIKDEIMKQMLFIRDWGGRFVIPIPEVKVL